MRNMLIPGCFLALALGVPPAVQAQVSARVDVEMDAGHGLGPGHAPNLAMIGIGSTVWLTRSWALSVGYNRSLGEDHREDLPIDANTDDVVYADMRHWRVGFRYRRSIAGRSYVLVGAGYQQGTFDETVFLKRPRNGHVRLEYLVTSNNLFGELHLQRRLRAWGGVRAGTTLTRDLDLESGRWLVVPTAALVLTF